MSDTETLLRELLETIAAEQGYKDYHIALNPFSSGGANYTSQLYHVTLSAPDKDDLKLFAKVACVSEHVRDQAMSKIFETEMYFYTDLLKRYQELEEKFHVPKQHRLATVKFYGCSKEYLKEILVLEDISSIGFDTHNRFKIFDWEYASKAIEELAKMHALSIALSKEDPEEFKTLSGKLKLDIKEDSLKPIMETMTKMVLAVIKEENRGKVDAFLQKSRDFEFDHYYRPLNQPVIAHGDFRVSNLMHRFHSDGQLELVVLDYQMLNVGNPILDLMYFIFSGSDEEFRREHYTQLLDHYYTELSNALTRLGVDARKTYPKEEFESDLKEIQPYGLFVGLMMVPMVTVEEENAPSMETDNIADFMIKPNELAITRLNGVVDDFIKWGAL